MLIMNIAVTKLQTQQPSFQMLQIIHDKKAIIESSETNLNLKV